MFRKKIDLIDSFTGEVSCSFHFDEQQDWELANRVLDTKLKRTLRDTPANKTYFQTAEAQRGKVRITLFSPQYPNPRYDPQVREIVERDIQKREEMLFEGSSPWKYSTEFLRKIHKIVEDELRRRSEEQQTRQEGE